jgi:transposase
MDANLPECPGCVAAARKIAELERRNSELERQWHQLQARVEELSRSAKRQAAPFSRGLPQADPKKPGRKPGPDYGTQAFRAVRSHIDETLAASLPEKCSRCGGTLVQTHVAQQYQVEIPRRPIYRQFHVAVGRCTCCGRRVQGRHSLQTSNALGCCQSQVGPEAQAAAVLLNKELGLSQGKISRFFQRFFGIPLTRGGSCQIMLRAAERCQPSAQALVRRVQQSPWIVPDETGWRVGGRLAWLHVAVGIEAVAYVVGGRGLETSQLLIGPDYAGTLIHDGWSTYDKLFQARHQTCLGHLSRRCHEMLLTATGGAVHFPRKVKALLQESLAIRDARDAGTLTPAAVAPQTSALQVRMNRLLRFIRHNPVNERLAQHLARHAGQLFTFLRQPGIDATNYRAEQAIRPAVVTTWTVKFNLDKPGQGQAALRVALAGLDGNGGLAIGVNGTNVGTIRYISTNALRYNTDTGVWRQYVQAFDGTLLKAGENTMTLTVPAGELTSGVVYDYLRLELNENARPGSPLAPIQ